MTYHQFRDSDGRAYGSLETFYVDLNNLIAYEWIRADAESATGYVGGIPYDGVVDSDFYSCDADPADLIGWYWQACFPGCLPDGDPTGPFAGETLALADAGALRTYTLPSHWAGALINGDASGLDDSEIRQLETVERGESLGFCIGVVGADADNGPEPNFCRYHDAHFYGVLACDCLDFIFEWPDSAAD